MTLQKTIDKVVGMGLPDKLHELLELAMRDLRSVEAMPDKYCVDMNYWHVIPDDDDLDNPEGSGEEEALGRCFVCLAGATLVRTLNVEEEYYPPHDNGLDHGVGRKFHALDALRQGRVALAQHHLTNGFTTASLHGPLDRCVGGYTADPIEWWEGMGALLVDLKAADI
jgi:hypothetical protein